MVSLTEGALPMLERSVDDRGMRLFGAFLVFVGVNLLFYAFPLFPDSVPLLVTLAFVDLGVLLVVLGMHLIVRAGHA